MVMTGLERPTTGRVVVKSQDISAMTEDESARFRRGNVGIVFQSFHLIPTMTALENVAVPLELALVPDAFDKARQELVNVGLEHRLDHYPSQLSGGEQQRVALARALAPRPSLIFADEPTGNLDGRTGAEIVEMLFKLQRERGSTLVLVTHDDALARRCDRIVRLRDGKIESIEDADQLPADGTAQITDLTSAYTTLGLWGPKSREILASVTEADLSHEAFGFSTCRVIEIGPLRVLASRISYVGDLGWELYLPIEQGARLWDNLWEAGQSHGMVPVGIGVYGTTGRLEKGYRAYGAELETEYNVVEAGMQTKKLKDADFIGRAAHLAHREAAPAVLMCTLTVDDHTSSTGEKRYMLGREPILTLDGNPIVDSHGRRSYVTSAGSAPSLGKHVLMAYLPPEHSAVGTKLLVEYLGEQYPCTVGSNTTAGLFDPTNTRIMA
jgi:predicted ABC-type transport system involved in lysophospholipase L1 biosynthesis ATPase subunit